MTSPRITSKVSSTVPPPRGVDKAVVPPPPPPPVTNAINTSGGQLPMAPAATPSTVMVTLTLESYRIYKEDDGAGGAGVDLYVGYIASGGLKAAPITAHGTTAVKSGLKEGHYGASQELFTRPLAAGGDIAVQLNLLEADESTSTIVDGYARSAVPTFEREPHTYSDAEIAGLMLSYFGAGIVLLIKANSDDDYGAWTVRLVNDGAQVSCRVMARDRSSVAVDPHITVAKGGSGTFTLRYVDSENDVECMMRLTVA